MHRKSLLFPIIFTLLLILLISGCKPSLPEKNPIPEVALTTYETSSFIIQVPENYLGAEPNSPGVNAIVLWMSNHGHDAQGFLNFIQANASDILFAAINTDPSLSGLISYFTLTGGERTAGFTVDEFVDTYNQTVGADTFLGREQKDLGDKTVEILLYQFSNGAASFLTSFYFLEIEAENQLWKFEFVSPQPDYDAKIEGFENIVAEFAPKSR